jgi:hypothetical protein
MFSSFVPIVPPNNDMTDNNEPLPIHGGGRICHYQISQGIEDDAITYVHYPSQEYNQGNTTSMASHQVWLFSMNTAKSAAVLAPHGTPDESAVKLF